MDKKRIALIVIFVLVTLIIGYALYRVFFAPSTPLVGPGVTPPPGTENEFPTGGTAAVPTAPVTPPRILPTGQPSGREGAVGPAPTETRETKIVTTNIAEVTASRSGGVQFYNETDGKFYRVGADGEPTPLSDDVFYNVQDVTWSPEQTSSVIEYPDGSNIYYNFASKEQVTLPKHWEDFSFSPQGDKLAAKSVGLDPNNRWLVVADPNGANVRAVEALGNNADKVTVDWSPNKQVVALSRTGEALGADRQQILLVGLNGENFPGLVVEGRDMRSQWSPEGKRLLYSVYSGRNDFKPELWITDAEGQNIGANRKVLGLDTWAEKCTFANERYVYCGVPTSLERGAGFAPDIANNIPDNIFQIDLQTGLKTQLPLDQGHVVNNIFVGDNGDTLYFTDKTQPGIFKVAL